MNSFITKLSLVPTDAIQNINKRKKSLRRKIIELVQAIKLETNSIPELEGEKPQTLAENSFYSLKNLKNS
jgi:hypothetical protein